MTPESRFLLATVDGRLLSASLHSFHGFGSRPFDQASFVETSHTLRRQWPVCVCSVRVSSYPFRFRRSAPFTPLRVVGCSIFLKGPKVQRVCTLFVPSLPPRALGSRRCYGTIPRPWIQHSPPCPPPHATSTTANVPPLGPVKAHRVLAAEPSAPPPRRHPNSPVRHVRHGGGWLSALAVTAPRVVTTAAVLIGTLASAPERTSWPRERRYQERDGDGGGWVRPRVLVAGFV